ncbi:hypothetical protein FRX31_020372 [Thalictrum thalictroides]|uniref:Uncharacterized protein n=1 Tax=Thalictrum thalictroides TaxID=46969 RepID=A0A7J6W0A5_THATH|nr:hypothetical protein FRX31_020372 [Thalictrum thalictroides]
MNGEFYKLSMLLKLKKKGHINLDLFLATHFQNTSTTFNPPPVANDAPPNITTAAVYKPTSDPYSGTEDSQMQYAMNLSLGLNNFHNDMPLQIPGLQTAHIYTG